MDYPQCTKWIIHDVQNVLNGDPQLRRNFVNREFARQKICCDIRTCNIENIENFQVGGQLLSFYRKLQRNLAHCMDRHV